MSDVTDDDLDARVAAKLREREGAVLREYVAQALDAAEDALGKARRALASLDKLEGGLRR